MRFARPDRFWHLLPGALLPLCGIGLGASLLLILARPDTGAYFGISHYHLLGLFAGLGLVAKYWLSSLLFMLPAMWFLQLAGVKTLRGTLLCSLIATPFMALSATWMALGWPEHMSTLFHMTIGGLDRWAVCAIVVALAIHVGRLASSYVTRR